MMPAATDALRVNAQAVEITLPDKTGRPQTTRLTHAEAAALNDYDAVALGLPKVMEAVMVVTIDGRVDMPDFTIQHSIEPFSQMHPWPVYKRVGALLFVGDRMHRLNAPQFRLFEAMERMEAAGSDIATRLAVWPQLEMALHASTRSHVLVQSDVPHIRITHTPAFPAEAMTRVGDALVSVQAVPDARWAMGAGRRYYLRTA